MNEKDKSKSGSLKIGTSAIGCIVALFGLLCAVSFSSAQTDPALVPDDSQIPGGGAFNLKVAALGSDGEPAQGLEEADAPTSVSSFYEEPDAGSATASTGGIFDEKKVAVPDAAEGKTILDAMHEIARSAGKTLSPLGTNGLERLSEPYVRPDKLESENFRTLLGELLPDDTVDIWDDPDSRFVYLGLSDDVSAKHTQSDVQRLARNHTRIQLAVKDKTLYDVVLMIADASKANILTSYMEPKDQVTDDREEADETAPVNVNQLTDSSVAKTEGPRRVTYRTQGEAEWRTVLRSVLEPDYTFDEKDGMVRVATKEKFRQLEAEDRNSIKMELRYVRVFHANPEDIVDRINALAVMENIDAKIQVAPYQEKAKKDNVNSFRHNLSSSSSSLSAGQSAIGDTGSSASGSWGNLLRPKNPPAILLYDNPGNLDRLEAIIREMDIPERQILIEALILDLTDQGEKKLGLQMEELGLQALNLGRLQFIKSNEGAHGSTYSRSGEYGNLGSWDSQYGNGNGSLGRSAAYYRGSEFDGKDDFDRYAQYGNRLEENGQTWWSAYSTGWGDDSEKESPWYKFERNHGANAYEYRTSRAHREHVRFSDRLTQHAMVFGPLDFNFILDMVQTDGDGKILSSPVLTIGDHSEAMIHVGNVEPIAQIKTTALAGGVNNAISHDIEWYELVTGTMLWVGPEVAEDGKSVRLWVHPKISAKSPEGDVEVLVDGNALSYPRLQAEELDTRVIVPSGGTLMLGGLIRNTQRETISKVPILGDIPLIGRLFRHSATVNERRNLVIIIRPTILDDKAPETGFEAPAMKIVDPMMKGLGRDLKDIAFDENEDPMRRREKKIKTSIREKFFGRKDPDGEAVEAVVEEVGDAAEAATENPEGSPVVEGPEFPEAAPAEEPAVTVETGN